MAARKKASTPDTQSSLFAAPLPVRMPVVESVNRLPPPEAMHGYADQFGGEDFPSRAPTIAELPRSVANDEEPKAPEVRESTRKPDGVSVVLHMSGQYLVERIRDNGTTYAGWLATRAELEALREAIGEALE